MKEQIDLFYGISNIHYKNEIANDYKKLLKENPYKVSAEELQKKFCYYSCYHIEAGNSRYEDYIQAMLKELGEDVLSIIERLYKDAIISLPNNLKVNISNEEEIKNVNPELYKSNKYFKDDNELLENFQRNSKNAANEISGELYNLDNEGQQVGISKRESNKKKFNITGETKNIGEEGESNNRLLDSATTNVVGIQSNKQSDQSESRDITNNKTINGQEGSNKLDDKKQKEHNSEGDRSDGSNVENGGAEFNAYEKARNLFIDRIISRLDSENKIKNTPELQKIAVESGLKSGIDYKNIKQLYDLASLALNVYILNNKEEYPIKRKEDIEGIENVIEKLNKLSELLPTETERSYDQITLQQFSTPLTLAYIASCIAEISENDTMLEPSAGEGNMAIFSKAAGAKTIVNEIDETRQKLLTRLGFDKITKEDAKYIHALSAIKEESISVVVMNPPFTRDISKGNKLDLKAAEKHVGASLRKLNTGGRLVAIVGKGMSFDSKTHKPWWNEIRKEYVVRANVLLSGDAYRKKGTNFDNRILVIDKIKNENISEPIIGELNSYKELLKVISNIPNKSNLKNISHERSRENIKEKYSNNEGIRKDQYKQSAGGSDGIGINRSEERSQRSVEHESTRSNENMDLQNEKHANKGSLGDDGGRSIKENNTELVGNKELGRNTRTISDGRIVASDIKSRGISSSIEKIEVERLEKGTNKNREIGYDKYEAEIKIKGSWPHPTILAESTAMASKKLPPVNYIPEIDVKIIEKGALSDAQTEDLILAGNAHQQKMLDGRRVGFFLGAGTGYGKGRTIAAIILDNYNKGRKKAVWISKNEKAHYDSKDYWNAVGGDKDKIFWQKNANTPIQAEEGVLLMTYGALKTKYEKETNEDNFWIETHKNRLQQIVQWLGKDYDGPIVFDESHKMANAKDSKGTRGLKKASQTALAGIELQRLLPNARVIYSSATGATEVSNLTYAQRLPLWGDGTPFSDADSFINTIESCGVAGMEIIAGDLKAMGLYTAKTLAFDGVEYRKLEHKLFPEQKKLYDLVASAWQIVHENINNAVEITGASNRARSAAMSAYWGAQQRFFSQIIITMQLPTVIKDIQRNIDENRAIVIQLVNTNEASQTRAIAESKEKYGENINYEDLDLSPKRMLIEYIVRSFPVAQFEETIDDNGNTVQIMVKDSEGNPVINPDAERMRDDLIEKIDREIVLPEGPLDILLNTFGADKVAEITGRTNRIVKKINEDGEENKVEESRTTKMVSKDKDAFMDGEKDILVFSDAGGTGASFHSDLARKNQKQRVHYVLQTGWRADGAVQGFGRSHRSNQRIPPIFVLPTTNLKAQARFLSSIARRLDQLGALTKGQRQTGGQGILDGEYNLEGKYAKQALFEFYRDVEHEKVSGLSMSVLEKEMGLKIYKEDATGNREYDDNVVFNTKMFLNRLLSLTVDTMDKVFDGFMFAMDEQISVAKELGIYDEGIQIVEAENTKVIEEEVLYTDDKTKAQTNLTTIELEIKNNKTKWQEINEKLEVYEGFKGFAKEINSGRIYGIVKQRVMKADGKQEMKIRRYSVVTNTFVESRDYSQKYETVKPDDARVLWNKEYEEYPDTRKKVEHIVKGMVLPLWSMLPENVSVKRYLDEEGIPHLGRYFNKKEVYSIRETFEGLKKYEYDLKEIIEAIKKGGSARLANGFTLDRCLHQGQHEIKIGGSVNTYRDRDRLERCGVMFRVRNTMTMNGDLTISFNNAEDVLNKTIEIFNAQIISAEKEDETRIKGKEIEGVEKSDGNIKETIISEKKENKEINKEVSNKINHSTSGEKKFTETRLAKLLYDNISKVVPLDKINTQDGYYTSGEYGDAYERMVAETYPLYDSYKIEGIESEKGFVIDVGQYYMQNGDIMSDPRIVFAIVPELGIAYPVNYESHSTIPQVYKDHVIDNKVINYSEMYDTARFAASTWITNLKAQGRIIELSLVPELIREIILKNGLGENEDVHERFKKLIENGLEDKEISEFLKQEYKEHKSVALLDWSLSFDINDGEPMLTIEKGNEIKEINSNELINTVRDTFNIKAKTEASKLSEIIDFTKNESELNWEHEYGKSILKDGEFRNISLFIVDPEAKSKTHIEVLSKITISEIDNKIDEYNVEVTRFLDRNEVITQVDVERDIRMNWDDVQKTAKEFLLTQSELLYPHVKSETEEYKITNEEKENNEIDLGNYPPGMSEYDLERVGERERYNKEQNIENNDIQERVKENRKVDNISDIEIVNYSDKAIAVIGNTKPYKDKLKELSGRYNRNLTVDGEKRIGWIFKKNNLSEVEEHLGIKLKGSSIQNVSGKNIENNISSSIENKKNEENINFDDINFFVGSLGNGTSIADKSIEKNGDYQNYAYLSDDGEITWYHKYNEKANELVEQYANRIKTPDLIYKEFNAKIVRKSITQGNVNISRGDEIHCAYAMDSVMQKNLEEQLKHVKNIIDGLSERWKLAKIIASEEKESFDKILTAPKSEWDGYYIIRHEKRNENNITVWGDKKVSLIEKKDVEEAYNYVQDIGANHIAALSKENLTDETFNYYKKINIWKNAEVVHYKNHQNKDAYYFIEKKDSNNKKQLNIKEDNKIKINVIPNSDSAFDKEAQLYIYDFQNKSNMDEKVKYLNLEMNYDLYILMDNNREIISYHKSPNAAYYGALDADQEEIHIVREKREDKEISYDYYLGSLWGDYVGEMYKEDGKLKKEVISSEINMMYKHFGVESYKKNAWKLKISEWDNLWEENQKEKNRKIHKNAVKEALKEGKAVPVYVVRDYPELNKLDNGYIENITGKEFIVLDIIKGIKSQYREKYYNTHEIEREVENIKKSLNEKGYLTKGGAINNKGKELLEKIGNGKSSAYVFAFAGGYYKIIEEKFEWKAPKNDQQIEIEKDEGVSIKQTASLLAVDKITPREVARSLIESYVVRGDSLNQLSGSHMGSCSDIGCASIGGYVDGNKVGTNKIIVAEINGAKLEPAKIFFLKEIYNEIAQEKETLSINIISKEYGVQALGVLKKFLEKNKTEYDVNYECLINISDKIKEQSNNIESEQSKAEIIAEATKYDYAIYTNYKELRENIEKEGYVSNAKEIDRMLELDINIPLEIINSKFKVPDELKENKEFKNALRKIYSIGDKPGYGGFKTDDDEAIVFGKAKEKEYVTIWGKNTDLQERLVFIKKPISSEAIEIFPKLAKFESKEVNNQTKEEKLLDKYLILFKNKEYDKLATYKVEHNERFKKAIGIKYLPEINNEDDSLVGFKSLLEIAHYEKYGFDKEEWLQNYNEKAKNIMLEEHDFVREKLLEEKEGSKEWKFLIFDLYDLVKNPVQYWGAIAISVDDRDEREKEIVYMQEYHFDKNESYLERCLANWYKLFKNKEFEKIIKDGTIRNAHNNRYYSEPLREKLGINGEIKSYCGNKEYKESFLKQLKEAHGRMFFNVIKKREEATQQSLFNFDDKTDDKIDSKKIDVNTFIREIELKVSMRECKNVYDAGGVVFKEKNYTKAHPQHKEMVSAFKVIEQKEIDELHSLYSEYNKYKNQKTGKDNHVISVKIKHIVPEYQADYFKRMANNSGGMYIRKGDKIEKSGFVFKTKAEARAFQRNYITSSFEEKDSLKEEQMMAYYNKEKISANYVVDKGEIKEKEIEFKNPSKRSLREGEFSKLERKYSLNKNFVFSGKDKIESKEDIAFLFRSLENEAVENAFAVYIKNNKPFIQHLSKGGFDETILANEQLRDAVSRIEPEELYIIHNHPSGNLNASVEDVKAAMRIKKEYGDIVKDFIIINLKSGKYSVLDTDGLEIVKTVKENNYILSEIKKEYKTYSFDKLVFNENYKSIKGEFKIEGSNDIASFISSQRLGKRNKFNMIILDKYQNIQANIFLPYTKIDETNYTNVANDIAAYMVRFAGKNTVLYGNEDIKKEVLMQIQDKLKLNNLNILDNIKINKVSNKKNKPIIYKGERAIEKYNELSIKENELLNKIDNEKRMPTQEERTVYQNIIKKKNKIKKLLPNNINFVGGVAKLKKHENVLLDKGRESLITKDSYLEDSIKKIKNKIKR